MADGAVDRFVDAATAGDDDAIRAVLAPDVRLRALLPGGAVERHGVEAAVAEVCEWFGGAVDVIERATEAVGDRLRVSYRLRRGADVMEQHGFLDVADGVVETLDLVCSGWRPESQQQAPTVHRFDAGEMGCTDGLAQEFKRRIRAIPVGDVLEVVARDPSAKADLPPLARMMGHTVLSVDTPGDGRLVFTVERGK